MDFKLTEEQKLIRNTAAQFVQRELLAREGAYLKQTDLFLSPGDPPRRELDAEIRATLMRRAKQLGLWALELPEARDGSATELNGAGADIPRVRPNDLALRTAADSRLDGG